MATDTAASPEVLAKAAKKAAGDARKMMLLTMFAVACAVLVLAIDHTIKRAIIDEAQKIRAEVRRFEEVAAGGVTAAGESGGVGVPADGAADAGGGGVADDPAARAAADGNAADGRAAGRARAGSRKPGP